MKNKQFLRGFENWKLNESYDMGAAPEGDVVKALIDEVSKVVEFNDYREANDSLRAFVEDYRSELMDADSNEIIVALEPWYDTFHEGWEAQEARFKEENPLMQADDIEDEDLDLDLGGDEDTPEDTEGDLFGGDDDEDDWN